MKFQIISFFLLLSLLSCETKTTETNCHISNLISPYEINFEGKKAVIFSFSPFEENKVFIAFQAPDPSLVEYDLLDKSFIPLDKKNYKFRIPRNAPVYLDKKDTSIWIGGNHDLKKISTVTDLVTTLPIKQVTRIIPFDSKMYFVSKKGFYKWDKKTQSHKKIKLPFKRISYAQLLDEKTLIFENKLTYNLETDSSSNGVQVYNQTSKENPRNFKIGNGIAAFPYGKNKVTLVFPNETRLVGLGNKPKSLNFQLPFIWKNSKHGIMRYDIEKNKLDTFRFTLPFASDRKVKFSFINQKTKTWIFKQGQLFLLDILTGKKYNYEFENDEKFISMKVDDCNVYLFFENKLIVKNQEEFIQQCQSYDDEKYLDQLTEFRNFRNASKISKDTSEVEVLKKLGIIKSKYSKVNHPEIQNELKLLNIGAFRSVKYETVAQLESCIRNKQIPLENRKRCYQNLISKEVRASHFENAVRLEKEFFSTVDNEIFSEGYKYYTGLGNIKKHLAVIDSLDQLNLAKDTLAYQKAMSLNSVCRTTYFCHEGCGGCDFGLVTNALNDFVKNFPNSKLRDNAEYDLLEYDYMYEEDIVIENLYTDFEKFIEKNPNSDMVIDAQFKIADFILNFIDYVETDKTDYIKKLKKIAAEYPENDKTEWINRKLKKLNEL